MLLITTKTGNKYYFDNSSGYIIPSSKDDILPLYLEHNNPDCSKFKSLINKYKNLNVMREFEKNYRNTVFDYDTTSELIYGSFFTNMQLVLSNSCNFRCEYCMYGNQYPNHNSFTSQHMSKSVVKSSIDFFIEYLSSKRKYGVNNTPIITFYGGEPLIDYALIKYALEYSKKHISNVGFAITTNGALLNQEISAFLIKNKFSIAISLDGYKSNHDRNRKLADGSPSFDIVWENIKTLRNISADNPIMLTFLCCIDSYTSLLELADFFHHNYDTMWPCSVRINPVNQLDTNYYHYCDEVYANSDTIIKQNHSKALEILKERMITNYYGSHTKEILSPFFAAELGIYMGTVGIPRGPLNNSCIPGSKITVLPDGRITPCEKVGDSFVVGSIYDGIDIDIIQKYCNQLSTIMEQQGCNKCQIRRLCSICFSYLNDNANIKQGFCKLEKESKTKVLTEICNNLEEDPDYYGIHINNYKINFESNITEEE